MYMFGFGVGVGAKRLSKSVTTLSNILYKGCVVGVIGGSPIIDDLVSSMTLLSGAILLFIKLSEPAVVDVSTPSSNLA